MGIGRRQLGKTPERQELGYTKTQEKLHPHLASKATFSAEETPFALLFSQHFWMSYSFVIPWEPCVTQLPLPSPRHTVFPLHTHQNHVSREMLLRDKQRFPAFPGASNWLCSKNILFSLREKLWYWSDHVLICSLVYHYCWTQATISKRHKNNYVLGMQVPETSIAIIFFHTSAFTVKRPWVRGRENKRKKNQ